MKIKVFCNGVEMPFDLEELVDMAKKNGGKFPDYGFKVKSTHEAEIENLKRENEKLREKLEVYKDEKKWKEKEKTLEKLKDFKTRLEVEQAKIVAGGITEASRATVLTCFLCTIQKTEEDIKKLEEELGYDKD